MDPLEVMRRPTEIKLSSIQSLLLFVIEYQMKMISELRNEINLLRVQLEAADQKKADVPPPPEIKKPIPPRGMELEEGEQPPEGP